ncbi:MAG: serine/threonine protein kinase [Myxococcota bacterium]|nr:serine/threonine protein kinase [Myxococcota bacterium]
MRSLVGRTLCGTYLVESLVGEGGMGAVYRVRHMRTGGALAIKLLRREAYANPDVFRRFQEEARITSALRHPNIVRVTDFDQDEDGTPFLVMELLEGENLLQRLQQMGSLPLEMALEMARQAGSALQAAHESGVVHRDVKPQNIFFARHLVAGDIIEEVKVLDFGLSKIRRAAEHQTWKHVIAGTPYYMAPEVARGRSGELDGRADQFSLAVVLYRALSGRLPFDADEVMAVIDKVLHHQPPPLAALVPSVPGHVSAAIERAMSKDRELRYPSMADFVRALTGHPHLSGPRGVLSSNPALLPLPSIPAVAARPDSFASVPGRGLAAAAGPLGTPRARRRSGMVAASGALLALALGALVYLGSRPTPPEPPPALTDHPRPLPSAPPPSAVGPEPAPVEAAPHNPQQQEPTRIHRPSGPARRRKAHPPLAAGQHHKPAGGKVRSGPSRHRGARNH